MICEKCSIVYSDGLPTPPSHAVDGMYCLKRQLRQAKQIIENREAELREVKGQLQRSLLSHREDLNHLIKVTDSMEAVLKGNGLEVPK